MSAFAQVKAPTFVNQQASARDGSIAGIVRDEGGHAVMGASIVALGSLAMPAMARSDATGRFRLALPPGQYILRATHHGYVSTYREPVRIQSSVQLERNITLVRAANSSEKAVLIASTGSVPIDLLQEDRPPSTQGQEKSDHAHNETAWRLRHLAPTALRDVAIPTDVSTSTTAESFKRRSTFGSFLGNSDLSGQVNFLTTSALARRDGLIPLAAPRGIAYVAFSASVGDFGDWTVRGATTAGSTSSWVVLGEYRAKRSQAHELNVGVSYSSQHSANGSGAGIVALDDQVRSAGGIYGFDRWRILPAIDVEYGARIDRYDYVEGSTFVSPRAGFGLLILPKTRLTASASERAIAPGSEEFLPPPSSGPWLPPERTFTPLVPGAGFHAERIRNYDFGIEQQFGDVKNATVVSARRFRQEVDHQIATLFGLDAESDVGHYYVGVPGNVTIDGMGVRLAAKFSPQVRGTIEYAVMDSLWFRSREAPVITAASPSVVRPNRDRLHDFQTSLEVTLPGTASRVLLTYRTNTILFQPIPLPLLNGRFNLELHQALPFEPIRGSHLELLLAVRNLFRDLGETGSMYDELLTVSPPMRIVGGVQLKF